MRIVELCNLVNGHGSLLSGFVLLSTDIFLVRLLPFRLFMFGLLGLTVDFQVAIHRFCCGILCSQTFHIMSLDSNNRIVLPRYHSINFGFRYR